MPMSNNDLMPKQVELAPWVQDGPQNRIEQDAIRPFGGSCSSVPPLCGRPAPHERSALSYRLLFEGTK